MRNVVKIIVSGIFAVFAIIGGTIFRQAIEEFAAKQGWSSVFVAGWRTVTDLGLESVVAFGFFFFGGATVALWSDWWLRKREESKRVKAKFATASIATFNFTKNGGELNATFNQEKSENVSHWVWYVNNGGTLHCQGVLLCIEFEKPVVDPEIFGHAVKSKWRELSSNDRSMYVEFEGWPEGEVVVQAIASKALGLDRRQERMIWREPGPVSTKVQDESPSLQSPASPATKTQP